MMRAPGSSPRAWRPSWRAALGVTLAAAASPAALAQRQSFSVDVVASGGYSTNPLLDIGDDTDAALVELSVIPRFSIIDEASVSTFQARFRQTEYLSRYSSTQEYGASAQTSRRLSERLSLDALVSYDSSIIGQRPFDAALIGPAPVVGGGDVGTGAGSGADPGTGNGTGVVTTPTAPTPGLVILPDTVTELGLVGIRERQNRFLASVGAAYQLSTADSIQGGVQLSRSDYGGNLDGVSFTSYGGSLGYSRALSTRTRVGVRGSVQQVDYDQFGSSGIYALQGTFSTLLAPEWDLSLAAGAQYIDRNFEGTTGNGTVVRRSSGSTGLTANGQLCRRGDRLNLCARAFREAAATGFGEVTRIYGAGVDGAYRLNETDYLRARVDYSNADGQNRLVDGLGASSYLNSGVSYDRRFSQRLSGGAALSYRDTYDSAVNRNADLGAQIFVRARLGDLQ